jgi:hypothetical protein
VKPITCLTDLKALPIWVVIGQEPQPGKKPRKVPYVAGTDQKARVNDDAALRTYAAAVADAKRTGRHPSCRIAPEMNLTLIDRDDVVDHDLIATVDSYAEESVNGGTHILVRGRPPAGFVAPAGIEVYPRDGNRFVLLTETIIAGRGVIEDRTDILAELFPPAPPVAPLPTTPLTLADGELLARAFAAVNGTELQRLLAGDLNGHGNDHSAADLAAASKLAFWTQDEAQIERIISDSSLGDREKWQNRADYRKRTIARALQRSEFYTPPATITRPGTTDEPAAPAGDPCTEVRDELAALRAENAALNRQLAERDATIVAQADLIVAIERTVLNPHLSHTKKMAAVALATKTHAKRAAGDTEPDGRAVLTPAEISDDFRPKPETGGHLPPVNPKTGTKPRMSRASVLPIVEAAIAEGVLIAELREVTRTRANGTPYTDWDFVVDPGPSLADMLNPWANYEPEQPKERKVREARVAPGPSPLCPHCGEAHPIVAICEGCGTVRDDVTVTAPMGDKTSPIGTVAPKRYGRKHISHSGDPVPFAKERRENRPDRATRHDGAAADLALREPAWLADAPDPYDTPPQPLLFVVPESPPRSVHFDVGD